MSTKWLNMLTTSWIISIFICIIIEGVGASFSAHGSYSPITVLNQLNILQAIQVGGFLGIPGAAVDFIKGLIRILLWDYPFYSGDFVYLRYFWMAVFSPGTVWGIASAFAYVAAQFVRPLSI